MSNCRYVTTLIRCCGLVAMMVVLFGCILWTIVCKRESEGALGRI